MQRSWRKRAWCFEGTERRWRNAGRAEEKSERMRARAKESRRGKGGKCRGQTEEDWRTQGKSIHPLIHKRKGVIRICSLLVSFINRILVKNTFWICSIFIYIIHREYANKNYSDSVYSLLMLFALPFLFSPGSDTGGGSCGRGKWNSP